MNRVAKSWWLVVCIVALHTAAGAEVTLWQLGGSGLPWAGNDSARVMIDFNAASIQPKLVTADSTVFVFLDNWSPKRDPDE